MDLKHEFDPDITMEPKVRYKLRSSLKKTKPKNPAGSLDNSESNDDTGVIPPLRRVSFAASNYVKPFLDDPEKNTIWDNTYEEEVNHTDSKSDTNNLLESKSNIRDIPNTLYDQSMVNMEFTCLDHTLKIEPVRNISSESSIDDISSVPTNVKNKNVTVFEADLEFTCQWKNNIFQINQFQNQPTGKGNLDKNSTTYQEETMNMTCRCMSSNKILERPNQTKGINTTDKKNMIMTNDSAVGCNSLSNRKENISPNDSRMEFTCVLPSNNIVLDSKTTAINTENKENIYGDFARSSKFNYLTDQSNMEFTCLLPNQMDNQAKAISGENKENIFLIDGITSTKIINDINKENMLLTNNIASSSKVSEKDIFSPNDSEMEFTCLIPNNMVKNDSEAKHVDTINRKGLNRSKPSLVMHLENKENVQFISKLASCSQPVFDYSKVSEKENICSQNNFEMEFTCLISNNIVTSETKDLDTTEKKNLKKSQPNVVCEKDNIFSPNDSEMEYTCLIPNNMVKNDSEAKHLDTINRKGLNRSKPSFVMHSENKENIPFLTNLTSCAKPVFTGSKVSEKDNFPSQNDSEMEFTCTIPNNIVKSDSETKDLDTTNKESVEKLKPTVAMHSENKENIPFLTNLASCSKPVFVKNTNIIKSNKSIMDFTCELPNQTLELENKPKSPEETGKMVKQNVICISNTNKQNVPTVLVPDVLVMDIQHKNVMCQNSDEKENLLDADCVGLSRINFIKEESLHLQTKTDVIGSLPKKAIQMRALSPEIKESSPILTNKNDTSVKIANKFNEHNSFCVSKIYASPKSKPDELLQSENTNGICTNPELFQNNSKKCTTTNIQNTFKQPKVIASHTKTASAKNRPLKIKEFGNIPIAVDITDLSIDQNMYDHSKDIPPNISTENCSLKENTYTIPKVNSQLNNTPGLMRNTNINELTYSVHQNETLTKQKPVIHETLLKPEDDKSNRDQSFNDNLKHKVPTECPPGFSRKNTDGTICYEEKVSMENQKIEQMPIIKQIESPLKTSLKDENVNINLSNEECSLIDSTLPSLHEEDFNDLEASLQIKLKDAYDSKEINDIEIQRGDGLDKISPKTKVIYSEPLKTVSGEFPSMHTTINPLNFSNIYSIEDTQQLIQATFSKPSDSINFENCNNSNSAVEATNMHQKCEEAGEIIIDKNAFQNEPMEVQSVFNNIQTKLVDYEYEDVNYDEIRKSINFNKEIRNKMKKLLQNFSFPEFRVPNLEARRRKMSLPYVSLDASSSDSFLDSGEDNYNKSLIMEPIISLHEKIVNLCNRSNNILSVKNFEDNLYVFSSFYECLRIFVRIHPEDNRVIEIETQSLLDDAADPIYQFLIKKTVNKLKHSTLKSYLGSYYDVLTLLDHIWLTVEDVINFHYEFLSLQKLYPTLVIHPDLYLCLEILQEHPPTWCKIRFDMTSVTKLNSESLQVETIIGNVNQEHVKQILRGVNEGVDSLKNIACNVYKYFKVSVKTLESIKLF